MVFVNVVGALLSRWRGACSKVQTLKTITFAFYITNSCLTSSLPNGKTPLKSFFGEKPDMSKVRVFRFLDVSHTNLLKRTNISSHQKPLMNFLLVGCLCQMPTFSSIPKQAKPQVPEMYLSMNTAFCKILSLPSSQKDIKNSDQNDAKTIVKNIEQNIVQNTLPQKDSSQNHSFSCSRRSHPLKPPLRFQSYVNPDDVQG